MTIDKYNEDQDRDNNGRFAGGGGPAQAALDRWHASGKRNAEIMHGTGHPKIAAHEAKLKAAADKERRAKVTDTQGLSKMKLFAQIRKVDEAHQLVHGRAVQEMIDRTNEVFDYEQSKPYFKAWSDSFSEATDGKSKGNIRAMHGKISAGIAKQIDFVDAEKAIDIVAHINDAAEWAKVLAGNYTGFSIGGSYVGDPVAEKMDGKDVRRYVANPSEISIVDSPCIPSAKFFQVVKADGSTLEKAFEKLVEVRGSDDDVARFGDALNVTGTTLTKAIELVEIASMLDTIEDIAKREFSTDERKAAAKAGEAMPDGSFPIKTVGDLHNAIQAFGRAKNKAATKRHIIARAKALGATAELPDAWKEKMTLDEFAKTAAGVAFTVDQRPELEKAYKAELVKGMWCVSRFAEALECLGEIARSAQSDFDYEGDDSPVPASLRNWVADGVDVFKAMADEESAEMVADLKTHAGVGEDDEIEMAVQQAAKAGALRKRLMAADITISAVRDEAEKVLGAGEFDKMVSESAKAGDTMTTTQGKVVDAIIAKAMSGAHKDSLQSAHDHLVTIGATCGGEKSTPAPVAKVEGEVVPEVAALKKTLDEATARLAKLESQPVPHVMLRTVAAVAVAKGGKAEDAPADPLQAMIMEKGSGWAVRNPDGSINYGLTEQKMQTEIGAAA